MLTSIMAYNHTKGDHHLIRQCRWGWEKWHNSFHGLWATLVVLQRKSPDLMGISESGSMDDRPNTGYTNSRVLRWNSAARKGSSTVLDIIISKCFFISFWDKKWKRTSTANMIQGTAYDKAYNTERGAQLYTEALSSRNKIKKKGFECLWKLSIQY